jgi:hypothetical protein
MSIFDKTVTKNDSFFYQIGRASTKIPWTRPTFEKVKSTLIQIKNKTNLFEKYNFYVIGAVIYDIKNTWDVDIYLTGNFQSYEELENDIYNIQMIFFENKLLPDISWVDNVVEILCNDDYDNKYIDIHAISYIKHKYIKKKINDEIFESDISKTITTLIPIDNNFLYKNSYLNKPLKYKIVDRLIKHGRILHAMNANEYITHTEDSFAKYRLDVENTR